MRRLARSPPEPLTEARCVLDIPALGAALCFYLRMRVSRRGAGGLAERSRPRNQIETSEANETQTKSHRFGKLLSMWNQRDAAARIQRAQRPMEISGPTNLVHNAHATFDANSLKFTGVPKEWSDKGAFAQFGCAIQSCPRVAVRGYEERIPAVLVVLRDELVRHNGLEVEGVFRVAATKEDKEAYKKMVDEGTFKGCTSRDDAMCMAALIKEWFRDMPVRLLNELPNTLVVRVGRNPSSVPAGEVVHKLPEPNKSVFLWLLDLLAETVEKEPVNKMNVKAVAIVLAPNIYQCDEMQNPQDYLREMEGAVSILEKALHWRLQARKEVRG